MTSKGCYLETVLKICNEDVIDIKEVAKCVIKVGYYGTQFRGNTVTYIAFDALFHSFCVIYC